MFQIKSLLLCHCIYSWHMSLKKYGSHIANMSHSAIMLNEHIDPAFCIYVPKHNKLQYLVHILLSCTCQKQICPSNATYANYLMCRYEITIILYMPNMNLLQSTMWLRTLVHIQFTLLAYVPDKCLPLCIYMSICTVTVVYL